MSARGDFWARRKAAVAAEKAALEATPPVERPDDEVLAELDLPEPEALETTEAVQDFLRHDLPQRLRARALRKLWRLNPVLANLDGLVDYGEDYTDAATVVDGLETVYQVGKGMLTALTEAPEADEAPQEAEPEEAPLIAAAVPQPLPDPEPAPVAAPRRRMRFHVEGAA